MNSCEIPIGMKGIFKEINTDSPKSTASDVVMAGSWRLSNNNYHSIRSKDLYDLISWKSLSDEMMVAP